jgi:hypothetical protein
MDELERQVRRSIAETIDRLAPDEPPLPMLISTVAALTADLVTAAPALVEPFNAALQPAGWRLVPLKVGA